MPDHIRCVHSFRRPIGAAFDSTRSSTDYRCIGHASGNESRGETGAQSKRLACTEDDSEIKTNHKNSDYDEFDAIEAQTREKLRPNFQSDRKHEQVKENRGKQCGYLVSYVVNEIRAQADRNPCKQRGSGRAKAYEPDLQATEFSTYRKDEEQQDKRLGAEKMEDSADQSKVCSESHVSLATGNPMTGTIMLMEIIMKNMILILSLKLPSLLL